ncbi:MAG: MCE family protein [Rhizobiales bacterium]|nr:MCE family protein [Hyphomicrobiales bacterium]OJY43370.1 MAG: ABC transporter [Rhizobiales bacterium 64-17]
METKASYTLIGFFTLAVMVGIFGFVYWFQNLGGVAERATFRIVFDSSVSGLRTGSAVMFNGIRIGEVTTLQLVPDKTERVLATILVDKNAPIRDDTTVGLEFQGLTGIAAVALSGGTASKPPLVGSKDNPPVLTADRSATQDVTQAAREVLRRVDKLIADNEKSLHDTMANIDTFTAALARNSARIDSVLAGIGTLTGGKDGKGGEIGDAARSFTEAAQSLKSLSDNLDKRTADISSGINRLSGTGTREIEALSTDARRTLGELERTIRNLDRNPSRVLFGGENRAVPEYNGRR